MKKPEVKKNHYKFKQRDVNDIVTGRKELRDKLLKWYEKDGYEMLTQDIRHNGMNGQYYISARLYRPPDKKSSRKTERGR